MTDDDVNPVRVNVRARPLNSRETAESAQQCVQFFSKNNQIKIGDKIFAFDNVYPPTSGQEEVYEECAAPLLSKFLEGYNCTLLAYGQTGSGKTFTMGTEETKECIQKDSRGIIPRIASQLFQVISESAHPSSYEVSVSMLEIYQEDVNDLLSATKEQLHIREQKGSVFVQGLSSSPVSSLEDTMVQLERGCLLRSKGSTAMNATSSRSHAIFTVNLLKTCVDDSEVGFSAKFHLVDLAGSERLKKTQAEGERKKEGIKINEGLLALGNVISALSERSKHVPYRDSKITRILQDSLGGNSCTVMIACISPADTNGEETLSTLRYADRTRKIKNNAVVNTDPQEAMIHQMKEEILRLRHEVASLSSAAPQGGEVSNVTVAHGYLPSTTGTAQHLLDEYIHKVCDLERKLLETSAQKAHVTSQLYRVEEAHERLLSSLKELISNCDADDAQKIEGVTKLVNQEEETDEEPMDATCANGDENDENYDEAFAENFVQRQEALSKEMEAVLQQIKEKEQLCEQTTLSDETLTQMKEKYMKEVNELQERINRIQTERDSLADQVKRMSTTGRLSEERRQRLQVLEKELSANKKKLQDMRKLEQLKKQGEQNARKMRQEIEDLKQVRVRLMKQLRAETEKYRQWKNTHERELLIMKNKERKLELEAARTKQTFTQQLEVFRRKYQEAATCNKRLQAQLIKSSAIREEKLNDVKLADQLRRYTEDELNLVGTAHEAELNAHALIDQRKALSKKLSVAKARRTRLNQEPATKRRVTGDEEERYHVDDELEKRKLDEEVEGLEKEIGRCNTQIKALQTDCGAVDFEARGESRWAKIGTIVHSRQALKVLFDQAASERRTTIERTREKEDADQDRREMKRKYDEERQLYERDRAEIVCQINEMKKEHERAIVETQRDCVSLLQSILDTAAMSSEQYRAIETMCGRLHEVKEKASEFDKQSDDFKRRSTRRTGARMPRSASASQMPAVEEALPRDTREARNKKIDRFGSCMNTMELSILNETSKLEDTVEEKKKKRKTRQMPSPIRRDSQMWQTAPAAPETEEIENIPRGANTTFVVPADTTFVVKGGDSGEEDKGPKSLLGGKNCEGSVSLGPVEP